MAQLNTLDVTFTGNIATLFDYKIENNPFEMMSTALQEVNEAFEILYEQYNISYDDFVRDVQFRNRELDIHLERLWDSINCDIYDHFDHGTLLSFELNQWKRDLLEWKERTLQAIKDFVKDEFHAEFEPGQPWPAYIHAA